MGIIAFVNAAYALSDAMHTLDCEVDVLPRDLSDKWSRLTFALERRRIAEKFNRRLPRSDRPQDAPCEVQLALAHIETSTEHLINSIRNHLTVTPGYLEEAIVKAQEALDQITARNVK